MTTAVDHSRGKADSIVILACDSGMFYQAQQCLKTIRQHCRLPYDWGVVAIDLTEAEEAWLTAQQPITIFRDCDSLPAFRQAPRYAYGQTCRPHLPRLFPGYQCYMWVDADVRFCDRESFDFYIGGARQYPHTITIAQELDPAYDHVRDPRLSRFYHVARAQRIAAVFGQAAAQYVEYFYCYNSGIFAMHRDSPVWALYGKHLDHAMQRSAFDHMLEQDAMLLAVLENQNVVVAPTTMNWLCSLALPVLDERSGRWCRPTYPHHPISALHLARSADKVPGQEKTWHELFKEMRLTE